jgi:hypothetical protein
MTTAPPASPLVAVATGAEVAAPLLPDVAEPSVEVLELPLVAVADELTVENAAPELPPAPVSPEVAEPVAVPAAPEPPDVLIAGSVAAPDAPEEPALPLVAVEEPFDCEFAAPVLPPMLVFEVEAEPELPVMTLPPADAEALPVEPPEPVPVTFPELPELALTAMPPVPAPEPPPDPPVLPAVGETAPVLPDPPPAVPPPAVPLPAVAVPEPVAFPVLPDVDDPPDVVVEVPDVELLVVVPVDVELPELPPELVVPVVAVPFAACSCAARTSSINIAGSCSLPCAS